MEKCNPSTQLLSSERRNQIGVLKDTDGLCTKTHFLREGDDDDVSGQKRIWISRKETLRRRPQMGSTLI